MEGKFSHKMSNEQIPDRKPSYRKAVGANTTENQAKNTSFQNDGMTSSDPVVARINSDVELKGSGSAKVTDTPMETFFIQDHVKEEKKECRRREKWSDFAESTTLHGFRFIFVRASLWVRLLWIFLLLSFTGYIIYSIYGSIMKYFDFPIATIMKIYHPQEGLEFPVVTLCPMTRLTKTKIYMTDDNPWFNKLGLNIAACNTTAAVRAERPCGEALLCCCSSYNGSDISAAVNCTKDYKEHLLEVIKKNKGSFNDRKFQEAYGPNIRRMIIRNTCQFGLSDEGCSFENFDPIVTELGLCYSFNSARHGEQVRNASYGDISAGLSVMLDLNLNDHMVGSFSEGIRIIVHHQGVYINPLNSLLVAPGTHAQINVRRKVYRNKKWPYETNCSETKRLAGFQRYTSEGCFFECLSNATASKCGCKFPSDSGYYVDRICFREDSSCASTALSDVFEDVIKCDCPIACDVVNYESTVSTAAFPNPSMISLLQNKGYNRTEDYLTKNLLLLQVGYTSLSYEHFRQKAQYDSGALMGEIGGNLGLFLGCSFLTICEFIDFAIYLCRTRNKKNT